MDQMTSARFIPSVLEKACNKHVAPEGIPCFHLPGKNGYKAGVCGSRAKSAGFNGKISKTSMGK